MTVTRHAKALAQEAADRRRSAQKHEYRRKLLRLQAAFEPPLSAAELADGLDMERRDLGRYLSESPRLRSARPDSVMRALIDAVLDGDLLFAAETSMGGASRAVLVLDSRDAKLLASSFEVKNLGGGPVPERRSRRGESWDDDGLWDLFGSGSKAERATAPESGDAQAADEGPAETATKSATKAPSPSSVASSPATAPEKERPGSLELPDRRRLIGRSVGAVGLGAMRLSTAPDRLDEADAIRLIHRALELGVDFIDTAAAYALDDSEVGHNERLIRKALESRDDREQVVVGTKAGLVRPGGRWRPDGRPEHLREACEAALGNLGVDALGLFQLHVVDPKVPFLDSVGELARLREEGKVRHVGLCNVGPEQIREALSVVPLASVQNAASLFDKAAFVKVSSADVSLKKGTAELCAEEGLALIAHSPVGGHRGVGRADKDRALARVARRHGVGPRQVALAWLLHMGPGILPIPGATRLESLEASVAARDLRLDDEDLAVLDGGKRAWAPEVRRRLWSLGDAVPTPQATGTATEKPSDASTESPAAPEAPTVRTASRGEVVLFVGPPAAGKTSRVQPFVEAGHLRLNRDERGGKLSGLVVEMARAAERGQRAFVLDNTYPTRKSREGVLSVAAEHGLPVRCLWIDTPVEESLYNACLRMLRKHGRLLGPSEVIEHSKNDPNTLPPAAVFHFFRTFEEPTPEEGFVEVERVPFERHVPADYDRKALLLDYDGTLRRSTGPAPFPLSPDQVEILPGRKEELDRRVADGWLLLGVSNQSAVAKRQMTHEAVRACFERTHELLGHDIPVLYSPHLGHRAGVWDRKPMPGLGVQHIEQHRLDRGRCLMVGDLESDELFARNCGIDYRDQGDFFGA